MAWNWIKPGFAAVGLLVLTVSPVVFAASDDAAGHISGKVTTADGRPLIAASITITSDATADINWILTSDTDGSYVSPPLPSGIYTVTLEKTGYQTISRKIAIIPGESAEALFVARANDENLTQTKHPYSVALLAPIDPFLPEVGIIQWDEATIERIPVARNIFAVSLLAPGTVQGDSAFGNLVSFGGASVAENGYYINGLDVTDQRRGLGCGTAPFEFYKNFKIKTGGLSAQYGRSLGGVIEAVTKSGSNDFHWGASVYWVPWVDNLSGTDPDVFNPTDGTLYEDNQFDETTSTQFNLWASGPIIKDKLFYFVLANPRDIESDNYNAPNFTYTNSQSDDLFWGAKVDWYLTPEHKLELTAFSDANDRIAAAYNYTGATASAQGQVGASLGSSTYQTGGKNYILKYTGYLTDTLSLSASYGRNEASQAVRPPDEPLVLDSRTGIPVVINNPLGGGPFGQADDDVRKQYRIDGEWFLGNHVLRFGIDNQERMTRTNTKYSGSEPYTSPNPNLYDPATGTRHAGITFTGGNYYTVADFIPFNPGFEVRVRHYSVQGTYTADTEAIYLEDDWQVTDDWKLNLGLRQSTFTNRNREGQAFLVMDDLLAPRFAFSWDVADDHSLKIFGSAGRYYLPVFNNTNVRFTGGEVFFADYYSWDGTFDANNFNIPGYDPAIIAFQTFINGEAPDVSGMIDADLEPMYQDEFILGFMKDEGNGWSWGVRTIFRDLKTTIEDASFGYGGVLPPTYALLNPGRPLTLCDPVLDPAFSCVTYSAAETRLPKAIRKYNAVEFLFEKAWDGVWFLQGSYTWAHSYGNYEGAVKSDNGQTDAGITTSFDVPSLMDYSYGDLPNDRRHTLKLYGAWKFAEHWETGANLLVQTGRPVNKLGVHPTSFEAASIGVESFYWNGTPSPRGSHGRTPTIFDLGLSLKYLMQIDSGDLTLGLDVFNVLNRQTILEINEQAEQEISGGVGPGAPNPLYGVPEAFQAPRYLRLSAEFEW